MWRSFCVILVCNVVNVICQNPEVKTNIGVIRGLRASDGEYDMYMGIPYAHINESNPFGVSIPAPPFEEVFEAYDDSAICPQIEDFNNTLTGSLDCMHLNIYVPSTASTENPLPVYAYIYGGYFMIGFAGRYVYGPKYLVRHDVIVVTFNYRLGPYGFMCLGTPEIPGNQGLKDQVTALRWIKNNIAAFGGDPGQVTIGGNSAGSVSSALHVMSETEILFDKIILQSGAPSSRVVSPDLEYPIKLAARAGYIGSDVNEALEYLKLLPSDTVTAAAFDLAIWLSPCPEKDFEGVEKFLSELVYKPKLPKAENITFIVGYNNDELLLLFTNMTQDYYDSFSFSSPLREKFDFNETELDNVATIVRQFYVGDNHLNSNFNFELSDFAGDSLYIYPCELVINDFIENGAAKVYRYLFSYSGGRNFIKSRTDLDEGGAVHADEIGYLFDISFFDESNQQDQLVVDRFSTLIANFIKYGDPTPETSELLPVHWPPIENKASYTMYIDSELTVGMIPFHERMAFWKHLYSMYEDRIRSPTQSRRSLVVLAYRSIAENLLMGMALKILTSTYQHWASLVDYVRHPGDRPIVLQWAHKKGCDDGIVINIYTYLV